MSPQNDRKPTKAERTAEAREKARLIREEQKRKEKRNKRLLQGGVVLAVVAVLVIIGVVVFTNIKNSAPVADNGPTPANANVHGGVVIGAKNAVAPVAASTVALSSVPSSAPTPTASGAAVVPPGVGKSESGKPVQIVAYVDFICPICQRFEQQYGADLTQWRDAGKATVEYRALGFLDSRSTTNYSSRAANAAACVVNSSPDKYSDYFTKLYEQQPAEGSAGLKNDDLKKVATDVGAADISSCVDNGTYRPYVKTISAEAQVYGITGTPTVFVDGQKWDGNQDFKAFTQAIIDAKK